MVATGINDHAAIQIPVHPGVWTEYTAAFAALDGIAQLCFIFKGTGAVDFLKFKLR